MGSLRTIRKTRNPQPRLDKLLFGAIAAKDCSRVERLLDQGASVEARNQFSDTALMQAANLECIEIMRLLIERGADINATDDKGRTPLMFACMSDPDMASLKPVELLLECGVDVNVMSKEGYTALMFAVESGSIRTVQMLLDAGADPNPTNQFGKRAIDIACRHDPHASYRKMAELLEEKMAG